MLLFVLQGILLKFVLLPFLGILHSLRCFVIYFPQLSLITLVHPVLERVPAVLVDLEAGDLVVQDSCRTLALHDSVVELVVHLIRLRRLAVALRVAVRWLARDLWHFIHHFWLRNFIVRLRPIVLRQCFRLDFPFWLQLAGVARVHILLRLCHLQALLLIGLLLAEIV